VDVAPPFQLSNYTQYTHAVLAKMDQLFVSAQAGFIMRVP
jgi:hypothetical protein